MKPFPKTCAALFVLHFAAVSMAQAQNPPAGGQRVRMVFVSDTNAQNGSIYKANADSLAGLFADANNLDPAKPYDEPVYVQDNNVNKQGIIQKIAGLQVRPNVDTVLFFYWGHGASDQQRKHFFTLASTDNVARDDVVRAVQAHQPRLAIVLSDTCSVTAPGVGSYGAGPNTVIDWRGIRSLLIECQGLCNVNACPPGQFSWNAEIGGAYYSIFTHALIKNLYMPQAPPQAGIRSWRGLLEAVDKDATESFRQNGFHLRAEAQQVGQVNQRHYAYSLPAGSEKGIRTVHMSLPIGAGLDDRADGLTVIQVFPNGAAARARIELGDVILAVDGRRMTYDQYTAYRSQPNAPATAQFKIAERCGCGCRKLHKDCGPNCPWQRGPFPVQPACAVIPGG